MSQLSREIVGTSTSHSPMDLHGLLQGKLLPGALSPGVKRSGREADHSPATSAEVNQMWIYTSTTLYAFMD
jgi:hypothetical protein